MIYRIGCYIETSRSLCLIVALTTQLTVLAAVGWTIEAGKSMWRLVTERQSVITRVAYLHLLCVGFLLNAGYLAFDAFSIQLSITKPGEGIDESVHFFFDILKSSIHCATSFCRILLQQHRTNQLVDVCFICKGCELLEYGQSNVKFGV